MGVLYAIYLFIWGFLVLDLLMDGPLQFLLKVIFEAFHILSRNESI